MTKDEQDKVLDQALKQYGVQNQFDMLIEESAELIQAINKMKRIGGIYKPRSEDPPEIWRKWYDLHSEIADVKILIRQAERVLDQEAIDISEDRKIERLAKRLTKGSSNP